jgi:DNA replication protein DnaD
MKEENKNKGYILIHRSLGDHWLWEEKRVFSRAEAWLDMLMECNHSERDVLIGGMLIKCKRGESLNSISTWAERWKWNKSKVVRFFVLLENENMIQQMPSPKSKHIRVCKYDSYQANRNGDEIKTKSKRNQNEIKTKTNKQLKQLKQLETIKSSNELPHKSNAFKETWADWIQHRKEIKKPLTHTTIQRQFKELEDLTEKESIARIEQSIKNSWAGLFPTKENHSQKNYASAKDDERQRNLRKI